MTKKTIIRIGLALVTATVVGLILPALISPTNCGGNSYALYACKKFTLLTRLATKDGQFDISKFGTADRSTASKLTKSHWILRADFLVRTNFTNPSPSRLVVIACERPFENVPQPALWNLYRKNPAHAVGYSDGNTGLISPAEFMALDLSSFVPLSSLGTNISDQSIQP